MHSPAPAHSYDEQFFRYISAASRRSAKVVVPLVMKWLRPASVLDVGCGAGVWLAEYAQQGIADYIGIDGGGEVGNMLKIPSSKFQLADVAAGFDLHRRFDLAQCLEVGEHIPTESSERLVASLAAHAPVVLFSAAVPGQGGEHHVNEQPFDYWRGLFRRHGMLPFDPVRPAIANQSDVAFWYRYNTLLYVHKDAIGKLPADVAATRIPDGKPIPDRSPWSFRLRTAVLKPFPHTWLTRLAVAKHRVYMALHRNG